MKLSNPLASSLLLSMRCRIPTLTLFAVSSVLRAQQAVPPSMQPPAGCNWAHVKALPTNTKVHIATDHGGETCRIFSLSDNTLTCAKGGNTAGTVFERTEIKHTKLAHYLRSPRRWNWGGTGAIAGGISGRSRPCSSPQDFYLGNIGIRAGGFAAIVGVAGEPVGGAIGGATDMMRGSSIYVRP